MSKISASIIAGLAMSLALPSTAIAEGELKFGEQKPMLLATPPMGWNSWNRFKCSIDEATVKSMADAMVASGMKDAGYQYVNLDGCWAAGRDKDGNIIVDAKKFPSGMKALADYVHAKSLKFGIYSDGGTQTCDGSPGSMGYEFQDARAYAAWGVDYLKYDWCNSGTADTKASYTIMAVALRRTGRDIVFSICEWGLTKPWTWGEKIGHLWRTTGDIGDFWEGKNAYEQGLMNILDQQADLGSYAGPGHWNDPDMMQIGNGGMTTIEYQSHFSLWAILSAPLIAGNDLTKMSAETRNILTNKDVIAVNQDELGKQGSRIYSASQAEIWTKPLKGGDWAVILFNRADSPQKIGVKWPHLHITGETALSFRDLWSKKAYKDVRNGFSTNVAGHGVVMLRINNPLAPAAS